MPILMSEIKFSLHTRLDSSKHVKVNKEEEKAIGNELSVANYLLKLILEFPRYTPIKCFFYLSNILLQIKF